MHKKIAEALELLKILGLPPSQQNPRTALCLLALLNLTSDRSWKEAENPLIGITPIMKWIKDNYQKEYAPNTRETFRRESMHQFVAAGIVLYNPDDPKRPVNSPKTVYQIESITLDLLRSFNTKKWNKKLKEYFSQRQKLSDLYAKKRKLNLIPVKISSKNKISLSPGAHSKLIKAIIEEFAPRFVPGGILIYVGDTGKKWGYFDKKLWLR
jgi:hypothetical protein